MPGVAGDPNHQLNGILDPAQLVQIRNQTGQSDIEADSFNYAGDAQPAGQQPAPPGMPAVRAPRSRRAQAQ